MSIDKYLAELERHLRVGRRARRRIAQEIGAHLEEVTSREEQGGLARKEAEERAIERLGPADLLGAQFPEHKRLPSSVLSGAAGVALAGTSAAAVALVVTFGGTMGARVPPAAPHLMATPGLASTFSDPLVGVDAIDSALATTPSVSGITVTSPADGSSIHWAVTSLSTLPPTIWSIAADGSSISTITVTARDAFGNSVSSKTTDNGATYTATISGH